MPVTTRIMTFFNRKSENPHKHTVPGLLLSGGIICQMMGSRNPRCEPGCRSDPCEPSTGAISFFPLEGIDFLPALEISLEYNLRVLRKK